MLMLLLLLLLLLQDPVIQDWKIRITEVDPETGWFYDHALISAAMRPIVEQLDHSHLNDIPGLENPTIELMAGWLWKKLDPQLPGLAEIVIHETPRARCSYKGE